MRLFVAVDLDEPARTAIAAEQTKLAARLGDKSRALRFVRAEHLHVTLAFIGDVGEAAGAAVAAAMSDPLEQPRLRLVFGGIGVLPPRGRPRVVFVGIAAGAPELVTLQYRVADRLKAVGVSLEDRAFQPHLTMARWREGLPSDRAAVLRTDMGEIASVEVDGVTLYESRLSSSGPAYTARARAPFS
jgi:2'-5' RNA ligase